MIHVVNPIAEIFSQGDEVVTGEIADTNAAWLAGQLSGLGFEISRHTTVGDNLDALVGLLREISGRADLCLCTGGLGPTCDDLTAQAVGLAFGRPLDLDAVALGRIEAWFNRMDRAMPTVNLKQAMLPRGVTRLDNHWGTAPGFTLVAGRCRFVFMPGVPREMQAMFIEAIRPGLPGLFDLTPRRRVALRTIGLGESALQERLNTLELPPEMQLGFRAGGAENEVKLTFPASIEPSRMEATIKAVSAALGEAVYAVVRNGAGPASLVETLGEMLRARAASLSLLESVSGGLLASRCGGEDWLSSALVESATDRLPARFGVESTGRPSEQARRLASLLRNPAGQPDACEPVETRAARYTLVQWTETPLPARRDETECIKLFIAVSGPHGETVERRVLTGSWQRKRDAAAAFSLDVLRRFLIAEGSA